MGDTGPEDDPVLLSHCRTLKIICRSIEAFCDEISKNAYRPPILDLNTKYSEPEVAGLTKFQGLCGKELAHHEYLLKASGSVGSLSSNTPFLLAMWKEVLSAPKPVIALNPSVKLAAGLPNLKFDVLSANGNRWHKINTVKMSRLFAELQELEIVAPEESASPDIADSKWQQVSLVRQCLDLRTAARNRGAGMKDIPSLTYRLTRMDETCEDRRIQALYGIIRGLDVELQFGDPEDAAESADKSLAPSHTILSLDLNLDLSLLIALISDITHADLPLSDEETEARYQPIARVWKRATSRKDGRLIEDRPAMEGELGTEEHTRALTMQLRQESRSGLVEELTKAIVTACTLRHVSPSRVRFWTTREAMERCHDIARKIAGPREAYRARHMFGQDGRADALSPFWRGSRHQPVLQPMRSFRVGILEDLISPDLAPLPPRSFARRMASTCLYILGSGEVPSSQTVPVELSKSKPTRSMPPRPKVPSAHTTRSMLVGAVRGMTTVTANRMSVKQIVRNMGLQGLEEQGDLASFLVVEPKTLAEQKRADGLSSQIDLDVDVNAKTAALWVTTPRSLSETFQSCN